MIPRRRTAARRSGVVRAARTRCARLLASPLYLRTLAARRMKRSAMKDADFPIIIFLTPDCGLAPYFTIAAIALVRHYSQDRPAAFKSAISLIIIIYILAYAVASLPRLYLMLCLLF